MALLKRTVDDDDDDVLPELTDGDENWPPVVRRRRGLLGIFGFFRRQFLFLLGFVFRWYLTRRRSAFWCGVPAVLVGFGLVAFVYVTTQTSRHQLTDKYHERAQAALRSDNLPVADLCFQKMSFLDGSSNEALFGLGLVAERQGDISRAGDLMRRIAPDTERGHAKAHLWLAQYLVRRGPVKNEDGQELLLLKHHLHQAVAAMPNLVDADRMLADIYGAEKNPKEAAVHLERVSQADPSVLLKLAQLYDSLNRKPQAERTARRALKHFQTLTEDEPANLAHRWEWAASEAFLLQYATAANILAPGLQIANEAETVRYRAGLAEVFVLWYDQLSKTAPAELSSRLELLQQALQFGPNDTRVLSRLAVFTAQGNDETGAARTELKRILAAGRAPGIVHLILGTAALGTEDEAEGLRHLELAMEGLPQTPAAINNLAWALANGEKPDMDRASQLIEVAVNLAPQYAEIRETRGQIRARQGKTKEAIADLEFALGKLPGRQDIHRTLATLYTELGDPELAEQHRLLSAPK
jgi:tetratricopeptide (TPR) repeat protein